jgi:5-methylcytosine-specific restriction endonuclease McrA
LRRRRDRLYHGQNGRCHWCDRSTWLATEEAPETALARLGASCIAHVRLMQATADHITPRAHGGNDNRKNIVMACWQCNNERGSDPNWTPPPSRA